MRGPARLRAHSIVLPLRGKPCLSVPPSLSANAAIRRALRAGAQDAKLGTQAFDAGSWSANIRPCPELAAELGPGSSRPLRLPTERPSGPAGPFPKMFGKLSLELLQDSDGKLHWPQTLRCRLGISLIGIPVFAKGPKFISAQRVNESRETIAVPDAQQDTIQHYVLHS